MARILINVPKQIFSGQPFEVKVLISHPMESGQRQNEMGVLIPRDIITDFLCTLDDEIVVRTELFPAITANPFFSFFAVAEKSGTLVLTFTGDQGFSQTERVMITVT